MYYICTYLINKVGEAYAETKGGTGIKFKKMR